jgi:2-polyprenyl-6-methoxyphenol hydroxylase-like FAD-dependent oxidoreductase
MATSVPKSYQALNGKIAHLGRHAIVIGASMGGLLAGRALADYYDEVTLIDRDALPLRYEPRKGVPRGRHRHGLTRGRRVNAGSIRNRIRND